MTQQEIIEGNRLIEDFWQGRSLGKDAYISDFRSSWDLLMPVVEKIETLGYRVPIELNGALVAGPYPPEEDKGGQGIFVPYIEAKTKIEAVWQVVVNFIKWYNEKQQ